MSKDVCFISAKTNHTVKVQQAVSCLTQRLIVKTCQKFRGCISRDNCSCLRTYIQRIMARTPWDAGASNSLLDECLRFWKHHQDHFQPLRSTRDMVTDQKLRTGHTEREIVEIGLRINSPNYIKDIFFSIFNIKNRKQTPANCFHVQHLYSASRGRDSPTIF